MYYLIYQINMGDELAQQQNSKGCRERAVPGWQPLTRGAPQGSVLGLVLFGGVISGLGAGVESRFGDDTELGNPEGSGYLGALGSQQWPEVQHGEMWGGCCSWVGAGPHRHGAQAQAGG